MGNKEIAVGSGTTKWQKIKTDLWRYKFVYFLMIPGLLLLLVFNYYPLYFLQIAFKKYTIYSGIDGATWCGMANFEKLFETKYFLQSLKNTFIISFMKIVVGFPLPILVALLLNEIRCQSFLWQIRSCSDGSLLLWMPGRRLDGEQSFIWRLLRELTRHYMSLREWTVRADCSRFAI